MGLGALAPGVYANFILHFSYNAFFQCYSADWWESCLINALKKNFFRIKVKREKESAQSDTVSVFTVSSLFQKASVIESGY